MFELSEVFSKRNKYPIVTLSSNPSLYAYKKEFNDCVEYYNNEDKLHRLNGPAREFKDGSKMFVVDGCCVDEKQFKLQYCKRRLS